MDREYWKWSRYNIFETVGDATIIYNTRTSAIARIETEKISDIPVLFSLDELPPEYVSLSKGGFLVRKEVNEAELVRKRYLAHYHRKNRLNLVLLPSETCNLCCPYCFIYKYAGSSMNEEIISSVVEFVKRKVEEREEAKPFDLKISWYGGEPLLRPDLIYALMDRVNDIYAKSALIKIQGLITTNGVNLDRKTFDRLVSCGVKKFQITFDGGKEFHDKTRRFKDGRGSYDLIMRNLKSIVSSEADFKMALRINFLRSSLPSVKPLIDDLLKIIGDDKRFSIYCRPVYDFETSRDDIKSLEGDIFGSEEGLQKQVDLMKYIDNERRFDDHGDETLLEIPRSISHWCHADNAYSFTIGSDGSIYRCDTLLGDPAYAVGHLKSDGTIENFDEASPWNKDNFSLKGFERCKECRLLPICLGACKRNIIEERNGCIYTEKYIRELLRGVCSSNEERR